jgi:hypothetical protein
MPGLLLNLQPRILGLLSSEASLESQLVTPVINSINVTKSLESLRCQYDVGVYLSMIRSKSYFNHLTLTFFPLKECKFEIFLNFLAEIALLGFKIDSDSNFFKDLGYTTSTVKFARFPSKKFDRIQNY